MSDFSDKLQMNGSVICRCGGTLISNTGKIQGNFSTNKILCWSCCKAYDLDSVYAQRIRDMKIIYND